MDNIKILKVCSKCNQEKFLSDFFNQKDCKGGKNPVCKICKRSIDKKYILKNLIKSKIYQREYRIKNKERCKFLNQRWIQKNKKKNNDSKRKYAEKEENKLKKLEYYRKKRKSNINFRLSGNLSHRVNMALHGKNKSKRTLILLGCHIDNFRKHLESKFESGMNWDNYGKKGWHIGHIIPCILFDLSNPKEQEICFHYTNLKPQWENENFSNIDKLSNGKIARNLTKEEKLEYLNSIGINL